MHLPVPTLPPHESSPPAIVRALTRHDVLWNRPVFKAPPLDLQLPVVDTKRLAQELQRIGLLRR